MFFLGLTTPGNDENEASSSARSKGNGHYIITNKGCGRRRELQYDAAYFGRSVGVGSWP
jgi:hypothetical protein